MENVKNIIFDLGGVIMEIDVKQTMKAFSGLEFRILNNISVMVSPLLSSVITKPEGSPTGSSCIK